MSRYIDADKLRKDEIARCHCVPCVGSNDNNYKDLDEVLNDAPTADVEEVRHGEWVGMDGDKCSECGHWLSDIMDGDSYYAIGFDIREIVACPFCGARMDGERKD